MDASDWEVIVENLPMCYDLLRRLRIPSQDWDDMAYGIGLETVHRARQRWDPERARWGTYLYRALRNEYLKELGRRRLETVPLVNDVVQKEPEQDVGEAIQYVWTRLDEYERALLVLRFWQDLTFEEIAGVLGVTKSTVHYQLSAVLRKARKWLGSS